MKRIQARLATLLLLASAGSISAASKLAASTPQPGRTPVLLELFTSEGCSSCPAADRLLESLDATQPFADADLIVLSEHVDYWDGPGWRDPFSSKQFSTRQQNYANRLRLNDIYTPQVVIDGQGDAIGSNAAAIKKEVSKSAARQKIAITLSSLERKEGLLTFHAASSSLHDLDGPVMLYIALAEEKVASSVRGGENGGRALTHVAVVKSLIEAGTVRNGDSLSKDLSIKMPSGNARLVVFLQSAKAGPILGVAQCKLGTLGKAHAD